MIDGYDISILIMTLFLSVVLIYMGVFFFRFQQKRKFSFLQEFPYELTTTIPVKMYPIYVGVGGLFSLGYMSMGFFLFPYPSVAMNLLLLISWALTGMLLFLMFIIDMKEIKVHLLLDTLLFALSVLNYLLLATLMLITPYGNYPMPLIIIGYVLALFPLAVALNPKLKSWAKMDEQLDSQMAVVYVRPKAFVLAYSEWLLFLSNILFLILAFIVQAI